MGYSDDEPRDERGRWSNGGGGSAAAESQSKIADIKSMSDEERSRELGHMERLGAIHTGPTDSFKLSGSYNPANPEGNTALAQLGNSSSSSSSASAGPSVLGAIGNALSKGSYNPANPEGNTALAAAKGK